MTAVREYEYDGSTIEVPAGAQVTYTVTKAWKHLTPKVYSVGGDVDDVREYEVNCVPIGERYTVPESAEHVEVVRVVKQEAMAVCWLEAA